MAQDNNTVIGVGSPIVDTLVHVGDDFVSSIEGEKGGMVLVSQEEMDALLGRLPEDAQRQEAPGGSAGNTAFALAKLGHPTGFLGKVGNDAAATLFTSTFAKLGGRTAAFKRAELPNARCLSLVTPDGERTLRTCLGAAMTLQPEEITVEDFAGYAFAYVEGYLLFNPQLAGRVLACAREAGCKVALDLGSFEVVGASADILPGLLKNSVDWIFANEEEAAAFFGVAPESVEDWTALAQKLGSFGNLVALKRGRRGAVLVRGAEVVEVPVAYEVAQPVDTTGAGDYWAAGFLFSALRGDSLERAGKVAGLLAAEVVQQLGAELPEDVWQRIFKEI
jgi:sugar/nucleoside kinase (ribokinase family)